MKRTRRPASIAVISLGLLMLAALASNIDNVRKWAWGTNAGWINFHPTAGGDSSYAATVYADHLEGYVWGQGIGWVRLGTHTLGGAYIYGNSSPSDYGVNRNSTTGELSGYAWGSNVGWIKFNPTNGGVSISADGSFQGYAWSESVGWISFKNTGAIPYNVAIGNKLFLPLIQR
jgi:hypothetical protein